MLKQKRLKPLERSLSQLRASEARPLMHLNQATCSAGLAFSLGLNAFDCFLDFLLQFFMLLLGAVARMRLGTVPFINGKGNVSQVEQASLFVFRQIRDMVGRVAVIADKTKFGFLRH